MTTPIIPEDTLPVGPYSRIRGPHAETFCGGVNAFTRGHSVDASSVLKEPEGTVIELTGSDGRIWFVRANGNLIVAFRDRTEQEIRDLEEARYMACGVNFERARLDACRIVAWEMSALADGMRPEQCPSRQRRRAVKQRMLMLTAFQRNLLSLREVNARALREEMNSLGLPLPRRDYWGNGSAIN